MRNATSARRTLNLAAKALLGMTLLSANAAAQTAPRNCVACQWEEYHRGMQRDSAPQGPGLFESFFQGLAEGKREREAADLRKKQLEVLEEQRKLLAAQRRAIEAARDDHVRRIAKELQGEIDHKKVNPQ